MQNQDLYLFLFLLLILLWVMPWKGVALWKAAKRGQKKWFIVMLLINSLALLEIIYIFFFSHRVSPQRYEGKDEDLSSSPKTNGLK
jgi:hypothetical protein